MKGIFNLDSPLMSLFSRLADLMMLNLLMLICCTPIITIGASLTSMYYVLVRLHHDESDSVIKDFFHSFKTNFKQATMMWVIYLLAIIVLAGDYFLMYVMNSQALVHLRYVVYFFTALVLISFTWSFVLLSRYDNSIGRMLLNSFNLGVTHLIRTVLMVLLMLAPIAAILVYPAATPFMLLLGISLAGYLQTYLFSKVLQKLEQPLAEIEEAGTDA